MWVLLFNPTSGGGKGGHLASKASEILRSQGRNVIEVSGANYEEAQKQFQTVIKEHASVIEAAVVIGGDGMVHMAIQELAGSNIPMALVPAGTGNDFARSLELDLDNPLKILEICRKRKPVSVDLGKVNGRYFAEILSTGFDSIVNERANRLSFIRGRMKYNLAILLVLSTFKPREYRFRVDSIEFDAKAMLIAVSNGQSYGGGMKVTPNAKIDDGVFDVMILGPVSKIEFLKVFPKVFTGAHLDHPAVKIIRGKNITIESDAIAYADGERIGKLPVTAAVAPSALMTWRN